jgi:hypothetical protein
MATTECPICSRHVRPENLMMHVEACLTKQDQPKTPFRSPSPKTKSPVSSRPPTPSPSQKLESPSPSALKKRKRSTPDDVSAVPLAERMRPKDLDDLVGQDELLGPGKLLATLIQADRVPNMILWGYEVLESRFCGTKELIIVGL